MKLNGQETPQVAPVCDGLLAAIDSLGMAGMPPMAAPHDVRFERGVPRTER